MKHDTIEFCEMLLEHGLPLPETEHRFDPTRRWRFDYYWPDTMVALEVEGGVWINGGHTRGSGFVKNMEKYNTAAMLGIAVLRCLPKEVCTPKLMVLLYKTFYGTIVGFQYVYPVEMYETQTPKNKAEVVTRYRRKPTQSKTVSKKR